MLKNSEMIKADFYGLMTVSHRYMHHFNGGRSVSSHSPCQPHISLQPSFPRLAQLIARLLSKREQCNDLALKTRTQLFVADEATFQTLSSCLGEVERGSPQMWQTGRDPYAQLSKGFSFSSAAARKKLRNPPDCGHVLIPHHQCCT